MSKTIFGSTPNTLIFSKKYNVPIPSATYDNGKMKFYNENKKGTNTKISYYESLSDIRAHQTRRSG
jgi:hypothetical protein